MTCVGRKKVSRERKRKKVSRERERKFASAFKTQYKKKIDLLFFTTDIHTHTKERPDKTKIIFLSLLFPFSAFGLRFKDRKERNGRRGNE